jgi:hypothetical protein
MNILEEADGLTDLQGLTLDELAASDDAAGIVARLTRKDSEESEPVRVAAFNSFI